MLSLSLTHTYRHISVSARRCEAHSRSSYVCPSVRPLRTDHPKLSPATEPKRVVATVCLLCGAVSSSCACLVCEAWLFLCVWRDQFLWFFNLFRIQVKCVAMAISHKWYVMCLVLPTVVCCLPAISIYKAIFALLLCKAPVRHKTGSSELSGSCSSFFGQFLIL